VSRRACAEGRAYAACRELARDYREPCGLLSSALFEREDTLPIVFRADYDPAILLRLVIQRLRESTDLGVGKSLRRTVGVFALRIVVQHEHHQPRAVAGPGCRRDTSAIVTLSG
jgi:hypothetical protein